MFLLASKSLWSHLMNIKTNTNKQGLNQKVISFEKHPLLDSIFERYFHTCVTSSRESRHLNPSTASSLFLGAIGNSARKDQMRQWQHGLVSQYCCGGWI